MVPRFQLPFAQHFKNNPKFTLHCFESLPFFKLNIILATAETYSEPSQTSKMEFFAKIINSWKPLTIFAKCFILDTRQCSEYAPALDLTRLDNVRDLFSLSLNSLQTYSSLLHLIKVALTCRVYLRCNTYLMIMYVVFQKLIGSCYLCDIKPYFFLNLSNCTS